VAESCECEIVIFFHCTQCINEKPDGVSPRGWSKLSIGMTRTGLLQVWCDRHNRVVCQSEEVRVQ
jgi:hypothetical protein